ncbi:hypothetical protein Gotur_032754 [Gossypium turneri]
MSGMVPRCRINLLLRLQQHQLRQFLRLFRRFVVTWPSLRRSRRLFIPMIITDFHLVIVVESSPIKKLKQLL